MPSLLSQQLHMLTAPDIYISRHAVEQYRARALFCCERDRTDDMLRGIIKEQIKGRRTTSAKSR